MERKCKIHFYNASFRDVKMPKEVDKMNKYFFDEQNKTAVGMRSNPIIKDKVHTRTYELQKILGTGASCVVYVAKESGRSCLIKEFNPKYGNITRKKSVLLPTYLPQSA